MTSFITTAKTAFFAAYIPAAILRAKVEKLETYFHGLWMCKEKKKLGESRGGIHAIRYVLTLRSTRRCMHLKIQLSSRGQERKREIVKSSTRL
jgi:hypothetical protein